MILYGKTHAFHCRGAEAECFCTVKHTLSIGAAPKSRKNRRKTATNYQGRETAFRAVKGAQTHAFHWGGAEAECFCTVKHTLFIGAAASVR